MFRKILIANRGEIAVRVMRSCREMGITSVAVYSEADATALHARYADEAYCIGPAPAAESYLNAEAIIAAAQACGADAIHPGYGFLSEQSEFARACAHAGIVFIGPKPDTLRDLGDKVQARVIAEKAGVQYVPGSPGRVSPLEAQDMAPNIGFPLLIKAASGGGGKGIRLVESIESLEDSLRMAATEAMASFNDDSLYLERYLDPVRHIEVQVLADSHGNCVHLGERECSIQRRSQKVLEESPSVAVDAEARVRLGEAAKAIAVAAGYENAGTVEFLMDVEGNFYFIEANARLQVEHPVTELVTGLDLVKEQIRIAAGEPLAIRQEDIAIRGWAIECRITAENVEGGFLPSLGTVVHVSEPSGPGVRVDSSLFSGMEIGPHYDSLVSKLCVWAPDRETALARLARALDEYQIAGVKTTLSFHRALVRHPEFVAGNLETRFLERQTVETLQESDAEAVLIASAILSHGRRDQGNATTQTSRSGWRDAGSEPALFRSGGKPWRATF